ncbi:MAG TPA: response regulator transcription factor, partial [Dehalococcoidia bacterium]|nr:response regulator transcription factor [Dehalococcoidia bacterium]
MVENNPNPESRARAQRTFDSYRGAGSPPIRVMLADDHVLLRQSLRLLLEMHDEIAVVGEVDNGREAVELACDLKADVVLMDMRMPALNGIEATRQIRKRSPGTRVLMLTGVTESEQVVEALRAGASGYVVKQSDINELIVAIQAVHRGNPYFSGALSDGGSAMELLLAARNPTAETPDPLTAREREVLQLIAEGNSNQTIADQLVLSVKTIEAHKAHIMTKLRVQNQTDLIRYALRRGIIS